MRLDDSVLWMTAFSRSASRTWGDCCLKQGLFAAVLADEAHALDQALVDGLPVERAVLERFRHELDHIIGS